MRVSSFGVLAAVLAVSGCFELGRGNDLAGGIITGVVLDNDGEIAPNAVATVVDLGLTVSANDEGRFRFSGLPVGPHVLRLIVDADGNGAAELGTQTAAFIGALGDGAGGIDLGTVRLAPTGEVNGRVVDVDGVGVAGASVALWRNVELNGDQLDLAADLLATSGANGAFSIAGVVVGPARLAAFESVDGAATRASTPLGFTVLDTGPTTAADLVLNDVAGTRRARLRFTTPVTGTVELRLARAGGVRPAEPTLTQPDVVDATSIAFLVPIGVWDVYIDVGDDGAVLRSQVAPAVDGDDEVSWGVVALGAGAPAPAGLCGDGVVDEGESCDEGNGNGDFPDACRADCTAPTCGDGIVDADEGCDDGDANSDTELDACRTTCVVAGCGDGVVDTGEACDEGTANALTCTPDQDDCSWCDAVRCTVGVVEARAQLTVDVRSVQGWGVLPVAGVAVVVQGVERTTTDDGTATFVLDLPVSDEPIVVGGPDANARGRSWVQRQVPMPVLHHEQAATVKTAVYEGCRLFVDETTQSDPQFSDAIFGEGLVLDLQSHAGCDTLQSLRFEVGGQIVDAAGSLAAAFSMRVAAATGVFTDPEAFAAFPPTVAVDGSTLMCNALFDLQFDDGVHLDPTIDGAPLRPLSVGGSRAWLYDAAQGGFVEQVNVHDVELGFGLTSAGLWCLGEASTTNNACLVVDVVDDTGAAVADARVDVAIFDEFGTTLRRTTTNAAGSSACVEVSGSSTVIAVEGPAGARAVVRGVEFIGDGATSCAVDTCTHVAMTLPSTPSESCLLVRPTVSFGKGTAPTPGTLLLREQNDNGQQHRGSFPFGDELFERCIAIPNRPYRLAAAFKQRGNNPACVLGEETIDATEQLPSAEPPICGSTDCTSVDLEFFCAGS
jgi:hypothetical protein